MRTAALSLMTTLAIMLVVSANATAEIPWQNNLRSAHAQAQREGKLMLLHFYSDNCTWCDRLEQGSFKAPQVGAAIDKSFVPVKIHANATPKLAEMFKVSKFPTDVIVTTDGKTLSHTVSPQEPDRYVAMLTKTLPIQAALKNTATGKRAAVPGTTPDKAVAPNATAQVSIPTAVTTPSASTAAAVTTASSQSAPTYAATAGPNAAVSETPASESFGFAMPGTKPGNDGVKATLAASRTEAFALEMPAPSASVDASIDAKTSVQPEVAATSESTAAKEETVIPPSGSAADPEPKSKDSFKPDQAELAMQGFCPVTVISQDKWVEGRPEFGVIHLGKLYLFASEENMNTFLSDPIPFTPVLNEIDVVRFFEERKIVPGKREWGLKDPIYNRMFFFADEAAMNHFYNEYERYTDAAIEVMEKAVKDANPGI